MPILRCEAPSLDDGVKCAGHLAEAHKSGKDMPLIAPASIMGAKQLTLAVCMPSHGGQAGEQEVTQSSGMLCGS